MSDILKPLAELKEKWRQSWSEIKDECADELATVTAQVEREVAALTNGPTHAETYQSGKNSRDKEVAGLQAELSKLRTQLELREREWKIRQHAADGLVETLEKEIEQLRAELRLKTTP